MLLDLAPILTDDAAPPAFDPNLMQAPLLALAAAALAVMLAAGAASAYSAQQPSPPCRLRIRVGHAISPLVLSLIVMVLPAAVFLVAAGTSAAFALGMRPPEQITPALGWMGYFTGACILVISTAFIYDETVAAARRSRTTTCLIVCDNCGLPCPCGRPCPCIVRGEHKDGCHAPLPGEPHQSATCTQKCLCGADCPCKIPCPMCTPRPRGRRRNTPRPATTEHPAGA